jgi:uridine kinase
MEEIPLEERKKANYDHPDALEWELLCEHLQAASRGLAFEEPVYSFADYARMAETRRVEADGFVIVEGLFVLYWPELRSMLDTKVYVETGADVCFARRLARDVAERGRTPESVREQYDRTVRPSAERFVHPTAKYADLIVSGEEPLEQSVATVVQALRNAKAAGAR